MIKENYVINVYISSKVIELLGEKRSEKMTLLLEDYVDTEKEYTRVNVEKYDP